MHQELKVTAFSHPDAKNYVGDLARLRIEVFREFPYLYEGNFAYEEKYLQTYVKARGSVVVICFAGDKVVGASTGVPLANEEDSFKAPMVAKGFNPDEVFYFGESVLEKSFRGLGVGKKFFLEREKHARTIPGIKFACFCSVVRPHDHALRPSTYQPLDGFWRSMGYAPLEGAFMTYKWQDLDQSSETEKKLQVWTKALPPL